MYIVVNYAELRLGGQVLGRVDVGADAAAAEVGDKQLLHVAAQDEIEEGPGVFRVARSLYERAAVRHGAGTLGGVYNAHLRYAPFERRLFKRDAYVAASAAHALHYVARVGERTAVKVLNEPGEYVPVVALNTGEQRKRRGVARAGHGRVCERDPAFPARVQQVCPARNLILRDEPGVVDEHQRQAGKGRPQIVLGQAHAAQELHTLRRAGLKAALIGGEALDPSAEHEIADGLFRLQGDALQKLVAAASDDLDPDPRPLLELLDYGAIDLLLVGGVDDQPLAVLGRKGRDVGAAAAAEHQH